MEIFSYQAHSLVLGVFDFYLTVLSPCHLIFTVQRTVCLTEENSEVQRG